MVPVFFFCEEVRIRRIVITSKAINKVLNACVQVLITQNASNKVPGTCSKSLILVTGEVLIPLPIRAETAEFKLFLLFFVPKRAKFSRKVFLLFVCSLMLPMGTSNAPYL